MQSRVSVSVFVFALIPFFKNTHTHTQKQKKYNTEQGRRRPNVAVVLPRRTSVADRKRRRRRWRHSRPHWTIELIGRLIGHRHPGSGNGSAKCRSKHQSLRRPSVRFRFPDFFRRRFPSLSILEPHCRCDDLRGGRSVTELFYRVSFRVVATSCSRRRSSDVTNTWGLALVPHAS